VFYLENDNDELVLILATHVDDTIISRKKQAIDKFMDNFEQFLKIDRELCKDEDGMIYLKASMEEMPEEIIETFENTIGRAAKEYKTPAFPSTVLVKHKREPIMMTEFRSILGRLLYWVRKLAPPMTNATSRRRHHCFFFLILLGK
jgi:hypothetical protein